MGLRLLVKSLNYNAYRRINSSQSWNSPIGQSIKTGFVLVRKMSSQLSPPLDVRGMKNLQKELFDKSVLIPCIVVPIACIDDARLVLKSYFLKIPNFRPLQEMPLDGSTRGMIQFTDKILVSTPSKVAVLDPDKIKHFSDISVTHRDALSKCNINSDSFIISKLTIGYDNWKADEILRAVIPKEFESVSSYSICGHIIHLNLREQLQEYKQIIGDVLLEKVANARTVVNKTDNIDSTYRTFNMEILSGDNNMVTTVKENRCKFVFDFSKVYWNSRLSTEHERIVSLVKKGDVLYDVFCGVGPFSIPASKKGCRVLANDLNPESIKWLEESSKVNKTKFSIFNKDGRDFIRDDMKKDILGINDDFQGNIHIVMNLPALAVNFLATFRGLFDRNESDHISKLPIPEVHVYCFTKGEEDPEKAALKLVEDKLDYKLTKNLIGVYFVRNVAPMKEMMRVTFHLSSDITVLSDKRLLDKYSEDFKQVKRICS